MTHTDAAPSQARQDRGRRADLSGRAAENRVVEAYTSLGYVLLENRWRGRGGEVDLIFSFDGCLIFVEVKKARSIDAAICSLRPAQMTRIHAAASEYLAKAPDGQLSDVRFDLAAMDAGGQVQIIENAFGHF